MKAKLFRYFVTFAILPTLLIYPDRLPHVSTYRINCEESKEWIPPNTYDEVMQLLDDLESGEAEKKYSLKDLKRITEYFIYLLRQGTLPGEVEEAKEIEADIDDLMYGEDNIFELAGYLDENQYILVPAIMSDAIKYDIVQCGFISNVGRKIKKHKKAIIIGVIVLVAAAAITAAVVAGASATEVATAAGGIGGLAAADAVSKSDNPKPNQTSKKSSSKQAVQNNEVIESVVKEELRSLKENLEEEKYFDPPTSARGVPPEEIGKAVGPVLVHDTFNKVSHRLESTQNNEVIHKKIDEKFSSNLASKFLGPVEDINAKALSYQAKGETARSLKFYDEAVKNFSKAIEVNSEDPEPYLKRSATYFNMGQYDQSARDFNDFAKHVDKSTHEPSLSTTDLGIVALKGVGKGAYDSAKGMAEFGKNLVVHPVDTVGQVYQSISALAKLSVEGEWGEVGKALAPELHQLATEWSSLSTDERVELASYAAGKYGTDLGVPGAAAKIVSKTAKSGKELASALKNIQKAENGLMLETATGVGNIAKTQEMVNVGRANALVEEGLGSGVKEMSQLNQAGKSVTGMENGAKIAEVLQLEQRTSDWLGEGSRFIRNEVGDSVFLSKDGLRRVRFDFKNPSPHHNPHAHVEVKVNNKWVKSGPIYPTDVPHN